MIGQVSGGIARNDADPGSIVPAAQPLAPVPATHGRNRRYSIRRPQLGSGSQSSLPRTTVTFDEASSCSPETPNPLSSQAIFSHLPSSSTDQPGESENGFPSQSPQPELHRRRRPFPLDDERHGRSPPRSPPLLPSPPPSVPSVTEMPKDIQQLAGHLSRQRLEHDSGRDGLGSGSPSASAAASASASVAFRQEAGDSVANALFSNVVEFHLQRGGNKPVASLEIDMGGESRNDMGDCIMRPPSPDLSPEPEQPLFAPYTSSYDTADGPHVSPSLERIRQRHMATAVTSVRRLNLDFLLFTRQPSPEAAQSSEGQHPPAAGAGAEASERPRSATASATITAPLPRRLFDFHSRPPYLPLSPESLAMPHLAPLHNDVPSSSYDLHGWLKASGAAQSTSVEATEPMDDEQPAADHHMSNASATAPADPPAAAPAGVSVDTPASAPRDDPAKSPLDVSAAAPADAPATTAPHTIETLVEGMIASGDQCNIRSPGENMPSPSSPMPPPSAPSQSSRPRARRRPSKQYYTAYLRPQALPLLLEAESSTDLSRGPNPPVIDLEVDMEGNDAASLSAVVAPADASSLVTSRTASVVYSPSVTSIGAYGSQHVALSQRIRMVQMQLALEELGDAAEQSAGGNGSVHGSTVVSTLGDDADMDMVDPVTGDFPPPLIPDDSLLDDTMSLRQSSLPNGVRKYSGPLRYRLSAEVAMRCANLVHSKPRMRRRKSNRDGSERDSVAGSSTRGSGVKGSGVRDGAGRHAKTASEDQHRHRSRYHERRRESNAGDHANKGKGVQVEDGAR